MTAIVDYDTGNLRSVADALRRAGAEFTLTAGAVKSMTAAFPETICRTASRSSETVQPAGAPAG